MTCDVLRIFRADTLMRSTTMEKHDNVFIVRITGPIISRESHAIAGDHLYFLRRGICPFTDIDGGLTWSIESFAGNSAAIRSEVHTSELQSLMRISSAVFCLKKNKNNNITTRK